ncbi:MAG: glycogen synthase, partial [Candidatus Omnitrophica bacterium]|nr:glycogen synthase [Candidatus Omnitrophota bacterium]
QTLFARSACFRPSRLVFTIHNMAYQGAFEASQWSQTGLADTPALRRVLMHGKMINLMKAGIVSADHLSTVSPSHVAELLTPQFGYGLEKVLRKKRKVFSGILNGIDQKLWNPRRDQGLACRYGVGNIEKRRLNKAVLQKRSGLKVRPDVVVLGMVSRLAYQKGMDLLIDSLNRLMRFEDGVSAGERPVQFVLLGTGDARYEKALKALARKHRGRVACLLRFSALESALIYGGCDFFLMPSEYEPCGLGQLIAFRYGAVPIARRTGGLADTVTDADEDRSRGTGILFERSSSGDLLGAVRRALRIYDDPRRMKALRLRGMKLDFSWKASAAEYERMYRTLIRHARRTRG